MITYLVGDATQPQGEGVKVIAHICNDIGAWGAGFVMAISKRWKKPESVYRAKTTYLLGSIALVPVEKSMSVCNMIAQHGIGTGKRRVDYNALHLCLCKLNTCLPPGASVHMPRIGCGLAGGLWSEVEKIIKQTITAPVFVYDWKG